MLGDRFATVEGKDSAPLRYFEEIMRAKPKEGETEDPETAEKVKRLRILMALKDFDNDLLQESIAIVARYVKCSRTYLH